MINFWEFFFTPEQIRNINELVYEGIAKLPELSELHTMYDGIVYDKEIGFLTGGGLVGKAAQGCNPTPQDWSIGSRKVTWTPKSWEIFLDECASDLENTMVVYAMNKGTRVDDLTDTDYMAIVVEVLIDAIKEMFYRLIWFGDSHADNVDWNEYPKAAATEQTAVPTAAATQQTTGSPLVGDVYEVSAAADKVKCALADGTVIYLAAEKSTGNAVADTTYYSMDTEHKITPIEGTVYMGVAMNTAGAVKCALADGTIVYLNGEAATGVAQQGKTYYSKDTAHPVTINEGGNLTTGVDKDYFNILYGLFKQLRDIVALDANVKVTIAANSQTSKADQMSYLTPDRAAQLLADMWYKADIKLRQRKGECRFYVTQSIADKYEQYLVGKGIESTYSNLVDGVPALKFNGVPVIPMPMWDANIQSYFDLGDTYDAPHRALLTLKSVIAVGTPSAKAFDEVDVWYDKTSRKNYILCKDKLDAKILSDKMLIYAE